MATPVLGTLTEFNPDADTIKTFLERVYLYFTANAVALHSLSLLVQLHILY